MENDIVWLDVEILGEFKTKVFVGPGTVGLVAVGDGVGDRVQSGAQVDGVRYVGPSGCR